MGKVISRSASPERIIDTARRTLTSASARGGEVQSLAEVRLSALMSATHATDSQLNQARDVDDQLTATLMARDSESDLEIGAVCDEIWNAMGRPYQSIDYDLIVGGGKNAWTDGDPAKQHHLMGVLASNIRNSNHPKLAEKKEAWANRIEMRATAQAAASTPVEASLAQVSGLTMQRRTMADALQVGLSRLKRDYKNLGMTEVQIHEIIPDAPSAAGSGSGAQPQVATLEPATSQLA
jgi:hypothetical protein